MQKRKESELSASDECYGRVRSVRSSRQMGKFWERILKPATTLHHSLTRSVRRLLLTDSVVPGSPILVTLMKNALRFSETSVRTRATRLKTPEDDILHRHRRGNLKSYIALTGWTLWRNVMCLLWSTNWVFISQKTAFFIFTAVETSNLT
jgi:hypothetical protein